MKLNKWQILLGIFLTVMGAGLQFYTELPVGKLGMAVWVIAMIYGIGSITATNGLSLPFSHLNQAISIAQLPRFTIELSTTNTSLSLFVFMGLCLPSLWLGSFLLLKAYYDWSIFILILGFMVLSFALLSLLATVSEMLKDTTPTPQGSIMVAPDILHLENRRQTYQVTWYELRDIFASGSDNLSSFGNPKQITFVMSIAGELKELTLYQNDIPLDTRKLAEFLMQYRIKAQGREVPRIL